MFVAAQERHPGRRRPAHLEEAAYRNRLLS
jgi:hypothetical protein